MTIVTDFDHHLRPLMVSVQINCSAGPFARRDPFFAGFNPVVDRIANNMRHGFRKRIQNAFIKVGIHAGKLESHIFSAMLGHIAHHPRESPEKLFDRNHADFQHRLVQFLENPRLERKRIHQFGAHRIARIFLIELAQRAIQHRFPDD